MNLNNYNFVDNFTNGPAYILEDGKFFNLNDNNLMFHYSFERLITNELNGNYNVRKRNVTNLYNWIRINDGKFVPYEILVELPIKEITEEQYNSLLKFLDILFYKRKPFVEIGIEPNGSEVLRWSDTVAYLKKFDFKEYLPDDIVKEIRQQYARMRNIVV